MSRHRHLASGLASWILICLPLAHSANANTDREPIAQAWVSAKPLGVVQRCVVKALDDDRRTYSKISPSIRHVVKVIEPHSIVDIRPESRRVVADTDYHGRLEKIHDVITRIALYSSEPGAGQDSTDPDRKGKPAISTGRDIARAVGRCGTNR